MEWSQKAVRYSNYSPRYVSEYFLNLHGLYQHFSILTKAKSASASQSSTDFVRFVEKMKCPTVRCARLSQMLCKPDAPYAHECRGAETSLPEADQFLAQARADNTCPSVMYSNEDGLYFAQDSWLEKS